ncbi:hypothetical protein [Methylobacterium sp. E-046]|uniref:hypothetical protein n=1 Tax=Methylobacterium sp. E-046 TaxID=2836576 RepID=UPI001FBB3FA3|nr:hypothetical protein [Methylobacterium sp. E-046]MCJ2099719.1 hypothetical protein [Methylobacterium sp. E-046]
MAKKASAFTPPPEDEAEITAAPVPKVAKTDVESGSPPQAPSASASKALPSYRIGKRNLSAWIDERAFNQFKAMVSEEGKTIQDYMVEMVNREFARKGRPQIAK